MLWRTRGGYTANIKFSPELDTAEFGTQHGTGKFTADYNFKINNEGEWTADFKFNFIQYWEHEPYKEEERQGPFFAQDFSRMTSNPALRARKLAKPEWGMEGRSGDDFMELMAEEQILNQTVNWSFNYDWKSTGNWGDVEQYAIAVPGNKPKIAEHPLVFRKKNEV
jgi:hypothetical protein